MATRTYDITDFPNDKIDGATLTLEVENVGLSVALIGINTNGSDVIFEFDSEPTSGDETLLNTVVAAHTGEGFFKIPVLENVESDSDDDSGNTIDKVTLETTMLNAGIYFLSFSMEHSTTTVTGTSGSRALFEVAKNGNTPVERNQDNNSENVWKLFSAGYTFEVDAGDEYIFKLQHKRIGTSGNASKVRRARITLTRIGPKLS
jgi:hypothetical protein